MQRNQIVQITTLLEGWSKVVRVLYRQLKRDGTWQLQDRDLLDRGHGVSVLLYNRAKQTVLLLRQARIVATLSGDPSGETLEVCSGLIEDETALACALREVEQETGHRLRELTPVTEIYASPLGSLEIVHLFMGEYSEETRITAGGGVHDEGEDIEILEVDLLQAMKWIENRSIRDGRSIILLLRLCLQEKLYI